MKLSQRSMARFAPFRQDFPARCPKKRWHKKAGKRKTAARLSSLFPLGQMPIAGYSPATHDP